MFQRFKFGIIAKIPIYVTNIKFFTSNNIIYYEKTTDIYGIQYEYLIQDTIDIKTEIHNHSFPMHSYSDSDWFINKMSFNNEIPQPIIDSMKEKSFLNERYNDMKFRCYLAEMFLRTLKSCRGEKNLNSISM